MNILSDSQDCRGVAIVGYKRGVLGRGMPAFSLKNSVGERKRRVLDTSNLPSPQTLTSIISERQKQINAYPDTTVPQHPSIPEDRHSNPAPQRVPNHDRRSKIHAQHHSKSIVLLMDLMEQSGSAVTYVESI